MSGNVTARHNLAYFEQEAGNVQRAFKHCMLAARAGCKKSLNSVKIGYMQGEVTKEEYANTLRAYQKIQNETKSDARDEAQLFTKFIKCTPLWPV
jgi:hypothetical protein